MRARHLLLLVAAFSCSIAFIQADFGQVIVDEAVDLFAAQQGDDEADPRSMEDLLHWAISHSDPQKLAAQAEEAQRVQMVKDLKEQRRRVKELLDHVRSQTTETDMMKEGIEILQRVDASDTELLAALQALQVLVEPIDNANDLKTLGGITPVVTQLTRGSAAVAAAAAHVLGSAASNNPIFQRHLLEMYPEVVATLLRVSQAAHEESAVKGMYALAAMVRNLQEARQAFLEADGYQVLGVLLRGEAVAVRVRRKALSLFMDLVYTQPAAAAANGDGRGVGAPSSSGAGGATAAADGAGSATADSRNFRTLHLDGDESLLASAATAGSAAHGGSGSAAASAAAVLGSGLPQAVVSLLLQPDADMQEKALLVVQRLAADPEARHALQSHGAVISPPAWAAVGSKPRGNPQWRLSRTCNSGSGRTPRNPGTTPIPFITTCRNWHSRWRPLWRRPRRRRGWVGKQRGLGELPGMEQRENGGQRVGSRVPGMHGRRRPRSSRCWPWAGRWREGREEERGHMVYFLTLDGAVNRRQHHLQQCVLLRLVACFLAYSL